jgi:hypothetical protein
VEQVLFRLGDSSEEESLQRILVELATPRREEGECPGYATRVSSSLLGALCYLDGDGGERAPFCRLYAAFPAEGACGLIVGEGAREAFMKIRGRTVSGEGFLPPVESLHFGLIGLALAGWVLLFDEDLDDPVQESLGPDVRAAYLPLDEETLSELSPETGDAPVLRVLLAAALEGLSEREEE